jgi:protein-L-isoaspartate O-methyltransferase
VATGVRDPRVLQALRAVPRSAFVPADLVAQAYLDQSASSHAAMRWATGPTIVRGRGF